MSKKKNRERKKISMEKKKTEKKNRNQKSKDDGIGGYKQHTLREQLGFSNI